MRNGDSWKNVNAKDFEKIFWNLQSFIEMGDMTKMLCHDVNNSISQ